MQTLLAATDPAPIWITFLVIGLFVVVFPTFWCLVVWLISWMGDWHRLSRVYSAGNRQPTGACHGGVLGRVGLANYKFMLTVHLAEDGFFLEVMPLFRPGHPRLFIPWSAVKVKNTFRFFGREYTSLTIGEPKVGTVALVLPENLFQPPA